MARPIARLTLVRAAALTGLAGLAVAACGAPVHQPGPGTTPPYASVAHAVPAVAPSSTMPPGSTRSWLDLTFADQRRGWALGQECTPAGRNGGSRCVAVVDGTEDGGTTWARRATLPNVAVGYGSTLTAAGGSRYLLSESGVEVSHDVGASFIALSSLSSGPPSYAWPVAHSGTLLVDVPVEGYPQRCGEGLATFDGTIVHPLPGQPVRPGSDEGLGMGIDGSLWQTAGAPWRGCDGAPTGRGHIETVWVSATGSGWRRTAPVLGHTELYDGIAVWDSRHAWLIDEPSEAAPSRTDRYRMVATTDGGRSWQVLAQLAVPLGAPQPPVGGSAASGHVAPVTALGPLDLLVTRGGVLAASHDGGAHLTLLSAHASASGYVVARTGPGSAVVLGGDGTVRRTSDGAHTLPVVGHLA